MEERFVTGDLEMRQESRTGRVVPVLQAPRFRYCGKPCANRGRPWWLCTNVCGHGSRHRGRCLCPPCFNGDPDEPGGANGAPAEPPRDAVADPAAPVFQDAVSPGGAAGGGPPGQPEPRKLFSKELFTPREGCAWVGIDRLRTDEFTFGVTSDDSELPKVASQVSEQANIIRVPRERLAGKSLPVPSDAVAGVLVPLGPRHDGLCWETPPHVVEAVRLDPSPVQLMQAHAPRAAGAHLEVAYLSGGHDLRAPDVSGVTPHVPAGLLSAPYPQAVSTPRMPVLELTLVQFQPPQDSSASCVTPEAALAAVLAALKLQAHVPRDRGASPLPAALEVATDALLEAGGYGPQPAHA